MNTRREPGEIQYWHARFEKWVPNKMVCYVSDNNICSLKSCNKKIKQRSSSIWKMAPNGKRFCSQKHASRYRWENRE